MILRIWIAILTAYTWVWLVLAATYPLWTHLSIWLFVQSGLFFIPVLWLITGIAVYLEQRWQRTK